MVYCINLTPLVLILSKTALTVAAAFIPAIKLYNYLPRQPCSTDHNNDGECLEMAASLSYPLLLLTCIGVTMFAITACEHVVPARLSIVLCICPIELNDLHRFCRELPELHVHLQATYAELMDDMSNVRIGGRMMDLSRAFEFRRKRLEHIAHIIGLTDVVMDLQQCIHDSSPYMVLMHTNSRVPDIDRTLSPGDASLCADMDCCICLDPMSASDSVRPVALLHCKHLVHLQCFRLTGSQKCPFRCSVRC